MTVTVTGPAGAVAVPATWVDVTATFGVRAVAITVLPVTPGAPSDPGAVGETQAGDAAAARDQYAALLPIRKQVSGPEHPKTLAVRASLAYFTGQAGDAAEARDQYAALLPIRKQVLGPEHPAP